jgi:tetratricopeptide (TPR) repeat protein
MITATEFVNFYTLLSVAETADAEVIIKAIRDQRRTWNKRAGQSDPVKRAQAEERIRQIAEAERVLLDPSRRSRFDQDVKVYRPEATSSSPDGGSRDWMANAREFFEQGNAPSAYYAAREAIAVNGASHEAWSIRANSSFLMGNYPDAEFEFKEAIGLQPNNPEYHFDYAEALAALEKWKSALGEYEVALRLRPGDPMFRTAIANVYLQNEIPEKALELMESVVRENPDSKYFQYYLALALHEVNLTKWSKLRSGTVILTSPAQIAVTHEMSGRALRLKFDDQALRTSLQENIDLANKAAEIKFFHAHLRGYAFALFVGLVLISAKGIGLLIVAAVIGLYVATHRMPVWKHCAKFNSIAKRGI